MYIETQRLILRQWRLSDYQPFAEMSRDPQVMRFFSKPLNEAESRELAHKFRDLIRQKGWGFWALELKSNHEFIVFCGLHYQPEKFEFSPCTEIGWRLAPQYWGQGLAVEAAHAVLSFAFERLKLNQVVAFTSVKNLNSEAVMKRLAMKRQRTFAHPHLPNEHWLSEHVLYAIQSHDFRDKVE